MNVHSPLLSRRSLLAASLAALPLQHALAQATAKLIVPRSSRRHH